MPPIAGANVRQPSPLVNHLKDVPSGRNEALLVDSLFRVKHEPFLVRAVHAVLTSILAAPAPKLQRPSNNDFRAVVRRSRILKTGEPIRHACMQWGQIVLDELLEEAISSGGDILIYSRTLRPKFFNDAASRISEVRRAGGAVRVLIHDADHAAVKLEGNEFLEALLFDGAPLETVFRQLDKSQNCPNSMRSFILSGTSSYRCAVFPTFRSAATEVVFGDEVGANALRQQFDERWALAGKVALHR